MTSNRDDDQARHRDPGEPRNRAAMKQLLKIGLLTMVAAGPTSVSAVAAPFASRAVPPEAVSIAQQAKVRRHYHEHYHRHFHQHYHYHYRTPSYYGSWYQVYYPTYGGYYGVRAPEFYGLDVVPLPLYVEPRYRLFHGW